MDMIFQYGLMEHTCITLMPHYPAFTIAEEHQMQNGTISWSAGEQTVSTTYNQARYPAVSVDSSGYVWIGYRDTTGILHYSYIIKSGNNDGTWGTTPAGFPHLLSAVVQSSWRVFPVPLTANKMLVIYARNAAPVNAKRWDGSSWGTERTTTSSIRYGDSYSAVAEADDVHLVFLKEATYDIIYAKYTYTDDAWGTEVTVQAGTTSSSAPVLSRNTANNNLYCFWVGSPTANHVYYKKCVAGTWDADPTDWIDESTDLLTGNNKLTCFYQDYGNYISLVYMTKTSVPYNVRHEYLSLIIPVIWGGSALPQLEMAKAILGVD